MVNMAISTYNAYLKINDIIISIYITDPPGQERFRQIVLNYCIKKDMIIFIYEIDDLNGILGSFKTVKELIKQVKEKYNNTHFALIGAKADLEYQRQVSFEEGEELAKIEDMDFFMEVSSHTGYNIDNMFFKIAKILFKNYN